MSAIETGACRGRRVLVTGADGFIGSHLVERLVADGAEVTTLSLYNSFGQHGWLDELPDDVRGSLRMELGDVRDTTHMRRLAAGHDIVFHLAALIGIPYSYVAAQSYVDVNVHGTLNLLEAVRDGDIGRLVHTSTSEVYGSAQTRPISEAHALHGQSPYAASKIGADQMAEAYARSHDVPVVILRPFNTFGPRQSERAVIPTIVRQMLDPACENVQLGDLSTTRDFNYVGDTADAFVAAGVADGLAYGEPYNTGTGVETPVSAVVEQLATITGCNKPVVTEAPRVRPDKSEVRALIADASRLHTATGWAPAVDLNEGLTRTVDWWQQRISNGNLRRETSYAV